MREKYSNYENLLKELKDIFTTTQYISEEEWNRLVRKHKKVNGATPSKNEILDYIKKQKGEVNKGLIEHIQMKPTRSISGVIPITIFTKPYKCSGNCIFCPKSTKAPKSYLPEEPGIQRAIYFKYDPYQQVQGRINALKAIGHDTNKVELIISGGTWDDYDLNYRIWYVTEVFRSLNNQPSKKFNPKNNYTNNESLKELTELHKKNETALLRNVGISIETRPDKINKESIKWYRRFGITKVQVGIQSLDEKLLKLNNREHSLTQIYQALGLLRLAGLKIHIHWMCNLYGSNVQKDHKDFRKLFLNKNIKPDEIKIYPCSILEGTFLNQLFRQGKYHPYDTETLTELLIKCKGHIPRYCRINRLIRDIPSNLIIEGNKVTNLRQKIQGIMKKRNLKCQCIRCREIKNKRDENLSLRTTRYKTSVSKEFFLEFVNPQDQIAGFLRLSIYTKQKALLSDTFAMIRELHVYGKSLNFEKKSQLSSQHVGLGTKLLQEAEKIVKKKKLDKISVIAAVGTRGYYVKRGYSTKDSYGYLIKDLNNVSKEK
jgi:elongator complex protein 3